MRDCVFHFIERDFFLFKGLLTIHFLVNLGYIKCELFLLFLRNFPTVFLFHYFISCVYQNRKLKKPVGFDIGSLTGGAGGGIGDS